MLSTIDQAELKKLIQLVRLKEPRDDLVERLIQELESLIPLKAEQTAIIEAFDGLIYICSENYTIEFMNRRFIERTGRYPMGEKCYYALHDRDSICPWCVNQSVQKGEKVEWEVLSPKDNRHYAIVNTPIHRPDGSISKMAMIRDITETKRSEQILRDREERYRTLFEQSRDAIAIVTREGQFVSANVAFSEMLGYSQKELKQINSSDIWADPRDRIAFQHELEKSGSVRDYEVRARRKDGAVRHCLLTSSVRYDENGNIMEYQGIMRDITEIKEREEAIKISEERYRKIVEDQTELVCRFRDLGIITFVNEAYCRYFDLDQNQLLGRSFLDFLPENDRQAVVENIQALDMSNQVQSHQHKIISPTGELRWQQWTNRAIFDTAGHVIEFQSVGRDVTDLVRAEEALKSRTEELERSNKDLEQFAYIAAHDLREPLLAVAAYLKVLDRRYRGRLDVEADKLIAGALNSTFRMDSLIQSLLAYSRIGNEDPGFQESHSEEILRTAMANLQSMIDETGARITHDPMPWIMVNPSQLLQLFQNLLSNAIKFAGENPPRIHVGATRAEDGWHYTVSDNGIGIEPPYFDRIFLLFQRIRNRPDYPGTGIGLANCRRIVEYHGGKIWVESTPGAGSIFHFTIPDRQDSC